MNSLIGAPITIGKRSRAREESLQFPTVKLLDYRNRQEQLETEANPFTVMIVSHLKVQETRHDPDQRHGWKLRLIKSLYRRGYDKQDILELFRFIDWLLELAEGLDEQLWIELETYQQGEAMPYVTSVERIGIKKGILIGQEEGRQEEAARLLRRQLTRRFGPLPDWAEAKLTQASTDQLEHWADRILDAESLDAVFTERGN